MRKLLQGGWIWTHLNARCSSEGAAITILEWGPGGGANLFGFRKIAARYYGVDISEKNLQEAARMISAEGHTDLFTPILLTGAPETIVSRVPDKLDLFLSTAVFQHFPSKEYGKDALQSLRKVCKDGSVGFIQIRFDNGNERYRPITSLDSYREKHITATSYGLDEFWNLCVACGFAPLAIREINSQVNYATFYMEVK